jgi:hypothetical protein
VGIPNEVSLVEIFASVVEPTIPRCIHTIHQGDRSRIRKRIEMGGIATTVIVGTRVTTDGAVIVGTSGVVTTAEISRHQEGRIGSFSACPSSPFILGRGSCRLLF